MNKGKAWLIIIVIIVAAIGFGKQITTIKAIDREIAQAEARYEEMVVERGELEEITGELENLSYVEILAREELNMVYPGETLYIAARPK